VRNFWGKSRKSEDFQDFFAANGRVGHSDFAHVLRAEISDRRIFALPLSPYAGSWLK